MSSEESSQQNPQNGIKQLQDELRKHLDWPQYFVSGENVDEEDFVPAYYRVEGPDGPVKYVNPNDGPYEVTMFHFAMEARADDFEWTQREDTPWPEVENDE